MKIYKYTIITILLLLTGFFLIIATFDYITAKPLDIVQINDLKYKLSEDAYIGKLYDFDYALVDKNGGLITRTSGIATADLNSALIHRDSVIEMENGNKIIIYNDYDDLLGGYKKSLMFVSVLIVFLLALIFILFLSFIKIRFLRPFSRMRIFAKNIAEGDLNIPLVMDRNNAFGAFTESFDIMREELERAREAEYLANKSKKELVASLSHDIKTPVASIKAVAELLSAKTDDTGKKNQLSIIEAKADQINTLITNMFSATLEELQELKVNPSEQNSEIMYNIIRTSDHYQKTEDFQIPQCLVLADSVRLSQIVDNIISNSYKYAGTKISVKAYFTDEFLAVDFCDYGKGVDNEELPFLFNKFYRAKNAEGKSGAGLGLYISRYFANRMSGDIICDNQGCANGFKITLMLKII